MKIYLASAAPGTEGKESALPIKSRLLSFHHIKQNMFEVPHVLNHIKKEIDNANKKK